MLLIFDCDGVLADSIILHNEAEAAAYEGLGLPLTRTQIADRFSGIPQREIMEILTRETGIVFPPDFEATLDVYKEKLFDERLGVIEGVHDMLQELSEFPHCVASSARLFQLNHVLKICDLRDQFSPHIFSAEMVARGKPFPDLFLYAAKQMGYEPEDCLVIEDAVAGVQAAKAAGMAVFGFTGASHSNEELGQRLRSNGAALNFADMCQLPKLVRTYLGKDQNSSAKPQRKIS